MQAVSEHSLHVTTLVQSLARRWKYVKHNAMAKSTKIVKRKPGRPPEIGEKAAEAFLGLRLPGEVVKRIDAWAKRQRIAGRSKAVRELIERGLREPKRYALPYGARSTPRASRRAAKDANAGGSTGRARS